jgi:putative membrane protein
MAAHILLMNAVAPAAALALRVMRKTPPPALGLTLPTLLQMLLFWAWHAPPMLQSDSHAWHGLMSVSLLVAAVWYWSAVVRLDPGQQWRAVVSLLVTAKLFCLLGVLYVFAPRALYPDIAVHHIASEPPARLADQHLAGLIMLTLCPLTYVLCGVWVAARWLRNLDGRPQRLAGEREMGAATGAP